MAALIVEKVSLDLSAGTSVDLFALCSSEPTPACTTYSLTFEGYLSPWTRDRSTLEAAP